MFHPLNGMTREEQRAANVREFRGDGTPYLSVPGLKKLESVRVGPQALPRTLKQRVPVNASLTEFQDVEAPLVRVETGPDGCPVLLRNIQSNDGIWQAGVPVYVAGEWAKDQQPGSGEQKPE